MPKNSNQSTGIGITGFIFLIFLTLKLTGIGPVAHWSWWAVTAPLWAPPLVLLFVMAIMAAYVFFSSKS